MARKGSEFGGHEGRVAPLPHELTPAERARLEKATMKAEDPSTATADSVRVDEAGRRGVGPVDAAGDL